MHYAKLAADAHVDMLEVASELDVAFETQSSRWRSLVAQVRKVGS